MSTRSAIAAQLRRVSDRALLRLWRLRYRDAWYAPRIRRVLGYTAADRRGLGVTRTVRLLGRVPGLWQRTIEQTPRGSCIWGQTLFVAGGPADHYVILNGAPAASDLAELPTDRTRVWGLHMEPEDYVVRLAYDAADLAALTSRFYTNCPSLIAAGAPYRALPPYVHWHVGRSYDQLVAAAPPRKTGPLCVITSSLTDLPGHRDRMAFLEQLDRSELPYELWGRGAELERFRGYRGFAFSKWSAYRRSRYSLVMENSVSPLYWTEKYADAVLSFTLPLYHGTSAIGAYFPEASRVPIDIRDPGCMDVLRSVVHSNAYDERLPAVLAARHALLTTQNLYAVLDRELSQ